MDLKDEVLTKNRKTNKKILKWFGIIAGLFILLIIIMELTTSKETKEQWARERKTEDSIKAMEALQKEKETIEKSKGLTLENYDKIKEGMDFQEVYNLLAVDTVKITDSKDGEIYMFAKGNLAANIAFVNKKVNKKAKVGF